MKMSKRFLYATSSCSYCDETNKYYYVFHEDGSVMIEYEGCGGYAGNQAKIDGTNEISEVAVERLEKRLQELYETSRNLQEEIGEFEMFLGREKNLENTGVSIADYPLDQLEAEVLRRKTESQEGIDELAAAGWQWCEIDTYKNDESGIRQTGFYVYMFAPDIDLTPLTDLVLLERVYGELESESQKRFNEWRASLPKNKFIWLFWRRI
ncbi:hypothetical protein A3C09_03715 [Candidatus Uhrbacteria bacterium RIFCSPHIGHO2_02_FULL_47_44]|nr:MAG: hypothetical protein A3C09_03715 [Candidatus Uhrbacteria bacterium RIFCSPHIGHO2_02_FULL_47_44]OGL77604.1 MAG: hypothetical protein A3E97_04990 [Candidatus Uhrbacteria bacterium RIFCSPHIGHO2_12_FULL_47_12]OGL91887.1 MAG: hypothetical protein A3H12_04210 [Candidatus Uhrbacteria bacterium RIFCSPLOWO2_12_FULL_47_9]